MGDSDVLWRAEPHTIAKLKILGHYLSAWMPILTSKFKSSGEVFYIDAFAGPGRYLDGEDGSPLVALRTALSHQRDFDGPVHLFFVEKDGDRVEHLGSLLSEYYGRNLRNVILRKPIHGLAAIEVPKILKARPTVCPTLVFLDQFGYSSVPMRLVEQILAAESCEIFSFMNWRDMNRYITDEAKWTGLDGAFGSAEWRAVFEADEVDRSKEFQNRYIEALKVSGGAKYVLSFAMHGSDDQLLYWLFFCSNNDRGLEEMKRAMWKVDDSGGFKFSDRYTGQVRLLPGFNQEWLAERLHGSLLGERWTVGDLRLYVLEETPCYEYNKALSMLEKDGRLRVLEAPEDRRQGSFVKYARGAGSDELVVEFIQREEQLGLF